MPETILTKTCSKCKQSKPIELFPRQKEKSDGCHSYCKECHHAWAKWYRSTPKDKESSRKRVKKWQADNKHKHATHESLHRAIRSKRVIRPNFCENCRKECKPEAHHHKGYAREFRFDVIWLCRSCHANI